jgi:hypothetical protein
LEVSSSVDSVQFLDATWPLLVLRLPPVFKGAHVMKQVMAGFDVVHTRKARFVVMADCSAVVKFPGPADTKMLTDWMSSEQQAARERELTLGSAVVLTSGPMRAFMSAMNWVRKPATPQVWVATTREAVDWCCDRLIAAGMRLTPAIEALRAEQKKATKAKT